MKKSRVKTSKTQEMLKSNSKTVRGELVGKILTTKATSRIKSLNYIHPNQKNFRELSQRSAEGVLFLSLSQIQLKVGWRL
jgi:hypothetical protein